MGLKEKFNKDYDELVFKKLDECKEKIDNYLRILTDLSQYLKFNDNEYIKNIKLCIHQEILNEMNKQNKLRKQILDQLVFSSKGN